MIVELQLTSHQKYKYGQEVNSLMNDVIFYNLWDILINNLDEWDVYLVAADRCEELGFDRVANALRWLSVNQKHVDYQPKSISVYAWSKDTSHESDDWNHPIRQQQVAWIPEVLWEPLHNSYSHEEVWSYKEYRSVDQGMTDFIRSFPENYKSV